MCTTAMLLFCVHAKEVNKGQCCLCHGDTRLSHHTSTSSPVTPTLITNTLFPITALISPCIKTCSFDTVIICSHLRYTLPSAILSWLLTVPCNGFLLQCTLSLQHIAYLRSTEASKIAFIISPVQKSSAMDWIPLVPHWSTCANDRKIFFLFHKDFRRRTRDYSCNKLYQ